jgi:hypothetical protein
MTTTTTTTTVDLKNNNNNNKHKNSTNVVCSTFYVNGICYASEVPSIRKIITRCGQQSLLQKQQQQQQHQPQPPPQHLTSNRSLLLKPIDRIQINVTTKHVHVNHDATIISAIEIVHALSQQGFPAKLISDGHQQQSLLQQQLLLHNRHDNMNDNNDDDNNNNNNKIHNNDNYSINNHCNSKASALTPVSLPSNIDWLFSHPLHVSLYVESTIMILISPSASSSACSLVYHTILVI